MEIIWGTTDLSGDGVEADMVGERDQETFYWGYDAGEGENLALENDNGERGLLHAVHPRYVAKRRVRSRSKESGQFQRMAQ